MDNEVHACMHMGLASIIYDTAVIGYQRVGH